MGCAGKKLITIADVNCEFNYTSSIIFLVRWFLLAISLKKWTYACALPSFANIEFEETQFRQAWSIKNARCFELTGLREVERGEGKRKEEEQFRAPKESEAREPVFR